MIEEKCLLFFSYFFDLNIDLNGKINLLHFNTDQIILFIVFISFTIFSLNLIKID